MTGKRAVAVTWLFHLVGDIHQPLHRTNLYSKDFPKGDRGGNLAKVRISGGGIVQLHSFWDGLLGTSTSRSSILGTVKEIDDLAAKHKDAIDSELKDHKTPEDWAKEGFALAVEFAYEKGMLKPANAENRPQDSAIPATGENYVKNAGEMARIQVYKSGKRLAQVIREVLAAN